MTSDDTEAAIAELVGRDRRVLELGPAGGHMSRMLQERGCIVVSIEVDSELAAQAGRYAESRVPTDVDKPDPIGEFDGESFDVILATDVFAQLVDPLGVLRRLRPRLRPGGSFVLSVPNVTHGSVRLALLGGRFPYAFGGSLDETPLRFFSRESVSDLLDAADLAVAEIHAHEVPIDATQLSFELPGPVSGVLNALEADPDARAEGWVIKALPIDTPGLRETQRRLRDLCFENARLTSELHRLSGDSSTRSEPDDLAADNERLRAEVTQLESALAQLGSRDGELRSALIDAHDQLIRRDEEIHRLREAFVPLREMVDRVNASLPMRFLGVLRQLLTRRGLAAVLLRR